jgi:hypothetical protein
MKTVSPENNGQLCTQAGDSYIVSLDSETLKMSAAFSQRSIRDTKPNLVEVSTSPPPGSYRVLGNRPPVPCRSNPSNQPWDLL